VEWSEDARLVTARRQLGSERLDVARHPPGVGPRIRRHERDPHGPTLYPRTRPMVPGWDNSGHGPPLREVHLPAARPGLAAPGWRTARTGQARADGGVRGLRRRTRAAGVLARGHARRRRAAADFGGREPRAHSRVSCGPCSERADEVGAD